MLAYSLAAVIKWKQHVRSQILVGHMPSGSVLFGQVFQLGQAGKDALIFW